MQCALFFHQWPDELDVRNPVDQMWRSIDADGPVSGGIPRIGPLKAFSLYGRCRRSSQ
jgi:hypothetical protein